MRVNIVDKSDKYYYTGKLEKGTVLSKEKRFGDKEAVIESYQVAQIGRKYFLLNDIETLEKGVRVNTKLGKGEVIDIGKNLCAVKTADGIYTFRKESLRPNDLQLYMKSIENFESLQYDIEEFNKTYNTLYLKAFIDNVNEGANLLSKIPNAPAIPNKTPDLPKATKADMPKDIIASSVEPAADFTKTPELPKPQHIGEAPKTSEVPKVLGNNIAKSPDNTPIKNIYSKIKDKISNIFKKPSSKIQESPQIPKSTKVFDMNDNELGDLSKVPESRNGNHVLSHISLNPNATHEGDKLNYHYKVGGDFKSFNHPVDEQGNKLETPPAHLQGRLYYAGEPVTIGDKEYKVKSHISPIGSPNDMLVENNEGKIYSTPRTSVNPLYADISKSEPMILENGKNKYHHQLEKGDIILKNGERHEVMGTSNKGHLTYNHNTKGLYWHDAENYDKPFRYNDFRYKKTPETGDEITFTHNGITKTRPVLKGTENGSAIVQVNKSDPPLEIEKGNYKYTGRTAHKPYLPEKPASNIDTSNDKVKTLDDISGDLSATDDFGSKAFQEKINKLNGIAKPHNIVKHNNNDYTHKLGIGNIGINTKYDPITKEFTQNVVNPDISLGKRKYKVLGFDEGKGNVTLKEVPNSLKQTKPITMTLDDMKDIIRNNTSADNSAKTENDFELTHRNKLTKKLANTLIDNNITDVKDLNTKQLADKLQPHVNDYNFNVNTIRRGKDLVEPESYKPVKHNFAESGNDTAKDILGNDWKDQIQLQINKELSRREKEQKAIEQDKLDAPERERINQQNAEAMNHINDLNEKNRVEGSKLKATKTYLENNKEFPDIEHTEGKNTELFFPNSSKFNNEKAKFVLVNGNDLMTSHVPSGDAYKPYAENKKFPPNSQQRLYGADNNSAEGVPNRKSNLEHVKNWNPKLVFNDYNAASDGTPVVDKHGFVMGGNDRTMAYQQVNKDKLDESVKHIKDNIDRFFDFKTPEEKQQALDKIDDMVKNGQRPMVARMVDRKYHTNPEDYEEMTTALNADAKKTKTSQESAQGVVNAISPDKIKKLYEITGNRTIPQAASTEKGRKDLLGWLRETHNPDQMKAYDESGNLSGAAIDLLKGVHSRNYINDETTNKTLDKLGTKGSSIRKKISDVSNVIAPLRQSAYSLDNDIKNAIGSISAGEGEKLTNGEQQLIKEPASTKVMRHVLTEASPEEAEQIMDGYYNYVQEAQKNNKQFTMFEKPTPEEEKEAYFEHVAKNKLNKPSVNPIAEKGNKQQQKENLKKKS